MVGTCCCRCRRLRCGCSAVFGTDFTLHFLPSSQAVKQKRRMLADWLAQAGQLDRRICRAFCLTVVGANLQGLCHFADCSCQLSNFYIPLLQTKGTPPFRLASVRCYDLSPIRISADAGMFSGYARIVCMGTVAETLLAWLCEHPIQNGFALLEPFEPWSAFRSRFPFTDHIETLGVFVREEAALVPCCWMDCILSNLP